MFSHPPRGRKGPPENELTSLRERKFAARAIVAGERNARSERPHRSSLPDVEAAAAVASRPRPSLASRVAAVIRHVARVAAGRHAAAILLSAASALPVGKPAAATYIGPEEEMS